MSKNEKDGRVKSIGEKKSNDTKDEEEEEKNLKKMVQTRT